MSQRTKIGDLVQAMALEGQVLDSVDKVVAKIQPQLDVELKPALVSDVMRKDLGMAFRKIKAISPAENAVVNLVLRQQFALRLIQQAQQKTRLICIDETWLGMEDFRRMKWQLPTSTNSVTKALWQPRISMILAIDSYG